MSKPERQHFIPQSYLKNFSEEKDKKNFIHTIQKGAKTKQINKFSIKDICVVRNLYSLPDKNQGNQFIIENFYADCIDSVFPEIIKVLVDESILEISFDTKIKVINTLLSLYFRTPKFLNQQYQFIDSVLQEFDRNTSITEQKIEFLGKKITINRTEANKIAKELKEHSKITFLQGHLDAFVQLANIRLNDIIQVIKIIDNSEFITSDNPVIIRPNPGFDVLGLDPIEYLNRPINPLKEDNVIMIPINSKNIVFLIPNPAPLELITPIQRMSVKEQTVTMYNNEIETFSEKWIMGSLNGLEKYLFLHKKYSEETSTNIEGHENLVELVEALQNLTNEISQKGIDKNLVLKLINELEKNPVAMRDLNMKKLVNDIKNLKEFN